ncbi:MAG: hypothetical protein GY838_00200 [bacterium]|nr:hypothetical protein [bacterium]
MDLTTIDAYVNGLAATAAGAGDQAVRMNEPEVYGLLDALELERCPAVFLSADADAAATAAWTEEAAALAGEAGRVLVKVVGRTILHKTEAGGVRVVRTKGATDVADALAGMRRTVADHVPVEAVEGWLAAGFVTHEANRPGQELLLALRQDPAFGACVVVGVGGTLTEWYGKGSGGGSTLILPAAGLEREQVARALMAHPLLNLYCAPSRLYPEPPLAVEVLVNAVTALAELGRHCGPDGASEFTLEEIEVNPAVVSDGRLVALDGVGLVSQRRHRGPRRPVARIAPLLEPRSAVVMGVSAKGANPGRIILDNLLRSDGPVQDDLHVVHPKEQSIAGVACVPDVASLPGKMDLAVVSIPAEGALAAITELVEQDKAESIILIPGGFAEAGHGDLARAIEDQLIRGHERPGGGPVMVGGNCLGIVSRDNYNTFFLPDYKLPFRPGHGSNMAMVSQSGAYLVTFASNYDGLIHPRASISFGNQMDLTVSDFLEHFCDVDGVNVIGCYVEGFRPGDGVRFLDLARRARGRGKQVVVFKAGKTALGAKAAASHTASLAGDYAVARSCLESAGVTVAATLDEFEDLLKTFTLLAGKPVGQGRAGIISNAGFECSTVMDALDGLELAVFDPDTQAELDEILPSFAHRSNPIDCTPMTATEPFCESCRAILASDAVDVGILSSVPVTPTLDNLPADPENRHPENLAGEGSQASRMLKIMATSPKPAVVVVDSGEIYDPMCRVIAAAGVPVFRKIDRAARALAAFCRAQGA